MTVPLQEARNSLLERAAAYVRSRLHGAPAETAEMFLRAYWERVPAEDLVGRDPVDLAGAALAHLHLAERRAPGVARVRVYTPTFDDHGWASTHTVVEVVVDDMPFLLDSISMELVRKNCGPPPGGAPRHRGGVVHPRRDRPPAGGERMEQLRVGLLAVLDDVRAAVEDWPAMRAQALAVAAELEERPTPGGADEAEEARDFLRFLADDHFVFLGFRDYDLVHDDGGDSTLKPVPGSGLGILREDPASDSAAPSRSFARVPPELRRQSPDSEPLTLTKASCPGHRPPPDARSTTSA